MRSGAVVVRLLAAGGLTLLAGTAAAVVLPAHAVGAGAQSLEIRVTATASYAARTDTPQATTADGDLPVARSALGEQARSVLSLDVPTNATSGSITIAAGTRADQYYGTPAVLLCPVTAAWKPGTGQDIATAPAYACTAAKPVSDAMASWTFDLGPALAYWHSGHPAFGLALVMDAATQAPEKVVFNVVASTVVGTAVVPPTTVAPTTAPSGADTTAATTSPTSDAAPVPTDGTIPATGGVTQPVPLVAQSPVVAPVPRSSPVAAIGVPAASRVAANVWLLLPGGVLVFLAIARTLAGVSDPSHPSAGRP
jgi:hypothetical protein